MAPGELSDNHHTITIITANIGYRMGTSYVRGGPDKCKRAFKTLVENKNPSLVFLQETNYQDIAGEYEFSSRYRSVIKRREDAFLYDDTELELTLIEFRDMLTFQNRKFKDVALLLPLERISMALVNTSKKSKSKPDILCVSWHGPHAERGLDLEKKEEILKDLLSFVKSYSEECALPFIIGGDFNFELAGAKKVLKSFDEMEVYDYDVERRSNRIDYFISSKSLTLIDVKPVPWNDKEANRILDHDPIIAKLQINSSEDLLKANEDGPNKTDCGIEDSFKKLDIQESSKIKKEDTAYVKEERRIKTKIAKEYVEEIEEKSHKIIKEYCTESSEETKKELKKKIVEEFKKKMEEFKNK